MTGDFVEKVLLLLLTGLITGLIVPLILKRVDARRQEEALTAQERRLQEQKRFEADLARQSKIIDSQGALLNTLTDLLWEYQLMLIAVPYYHQFPEQRDRYLEAARDYNTKAGELLGRVRAEISRGIRLTTGEMVQRLKDLYYTRLLQADLDLTRLIERDLKGDEANDRAWHDLQRFAVDDLSELVDEEIARLAASLRLSETAAR